MCAHAAAGRGMPPMLDIPVHELMSGGTKQVLSQQTGLGVDERHGILELIAKSEGPARLVECAPSPETAREGLIQKPTVGQDVQRFIRGLDVHGAQGSIPILPHGFECASRRRGSPEAVRKLAGIFGVPSGSEPEDKL